MEAMIFNLLTIISLKLGYGIMDRTPYFSNAYPTQWFLTFRNNEVFNRPSEQITNNDIINIISAKSQAEPSRNVTTLADAEREHIEQALSKCQGVVGGRNGVAHLLGLPRSTLQYRLKKYGLDPKGFVSK